MSKRNDYTKVELPNNIVAIKYLYSNKWGSAVWLFRCSCGKIFETLGSPIASGAVKSCGCLANIKGKNAYKFKNLIKEDLPNNIKANKFLYIDENRKDAVWLFKCHCGKLFKTYGYKITSGHTKSCGCLKCRVGEACPNFKNLTKEILPNGIKANNFLYMDLKKKAIWEFTCKCGNIFKASGSAVTFGHTKSCGCLNRIYNKKYKIWFRSTWELNFVLILDYLEIEWKYEPRRFKLSNNKRYIPDFYLPKFNMFIEIKGWWREDKKGFSISKEKTILFKKEYPQYNYYVIDTSKYQEWEKEFKFLLN